MLNKLLSLGLTSLLGVGLAAAFQPPPDDRPEPPPKVKKKGGPGPQDGLRKAYDLLRRIRSDDRTTGKPEERLRDWTARAASIYRDGVKAHKDGDEHAAQEYGLAAHDLARAVDHARNAAQFDRAGFDADADLPPPPDRPGPEGDDDRAVRDLRRAYDHIRDQLDRRDEGRDTAFYNDAARDLYNAARRDAEADRQERAGELARAAEAMSHVNEHLARASGRNPGPPGGDRPEPKEKPDRKEKKEKKEKKGERPERKKGPGPNAERPEPRGDRPGDELPPPL